MARIVYGKCYISKTESQDKTLEFRLVINHTQLIYYIGILENWCCGMYRLRKLLPLAFWLYIILLQWSVQCLVGLQSSKSVCIKCFIVHYRYLIRKYYCIHHRYTHISIYREQSCYVYFLNGKFIERVTKLIRPVCVITLQKFFFGFQL